MKKIILAASVAVAFLSCEKKQTETVSNNTNTPVEDNYTVEDESIGAKKCYIQGTGNDTLYVSLDDNLGTVSGRMYYKNHQKDSSFGDVVGSSNGDTIKVDYTFQTEGATSTREIWFLKKDGKLLEGIGNLDASGTRYADYKKIKFDGGHVLDEAECNVVEKALAKTNVAPPPVAQPSDTKAENTSAAKPAEPKKEVKTTTEAKEAETLQETEARKKAASKTVAKKK
ncbi:hypothetical protein [uncultured Chryseobacterium sp.]|uniref:hypothetical protein n=1 Tax=uncultured Chryseobacterium sp. TaxID=259322 RepID=UPI002635A1CE|nr:hypothetical protein [uncultured Chryseobacterium sp.]